MPSSSIGPQTQLHGGISAKDDLVIEGQVDGPVRGEAAVTLAVGARVSGDVSGRQVTIACVLRHSVQATQSIHLLATAEIYGDITAPRITVEDGAVLEGHMRITRAADAPAQSANERRANQSPMRQIAAPPAAPKTAPTGPRTIPELPELGRRVATRRRA